MTYIVGEPIRQPRDERAEAVAHYQSEAAAARAPMLEALLAEARLRLGGADPLAAEIDKALLHRVEEPKDRDLVWERLPSGEFAWLRP